MRDKQVRAQYTREFKLEAVRQVRAGQAISVVAKVLGVPKASLGNWGSLSAKGELDEAGSADKSAKVSPEQMEIARLRAENARLRMERASAKKSRGVLRAGRRQPVLQCRVPASLESLGHTFIHEPQGQLLGHSI